MFGWPASLLRLAERDGTGGRVDDAETEADAATSIGEPADRGLHRIDEFLEFPDHSYAPCGAATGAG